MAPADATSDAPDRTTGPPSRLAPPEAARVLLDHIAAGVPTSVVLLVSGGGGRPGERIVVPEQGSSRSVAAPERGGSRGVARSQGAVGATGAGGSVGTAGAPWEEAARRIASSDADPGLHTVETSAGEARLYLERHRPVGELVVVGAGHIARPLAALGGILDMDVVVLDDRPGFATRERFPAATRLMRVDFSEPFQDVDLGPRSHLVLVTRGHRYDYECLRRVLQIDPPPAYIGMIGSRRRVRATYEALLREGFDRAALERIHAPVGLDLGAETPEEIAVAVASELVLLRRGGTGRPLREVERVAERFFPADEDGEGAEDGVGAESGEDVEGAEWGEGCGGDEGGGGREGCRTGADRRKGVRGGAGEEADAVSADAPTGPEDRRLYAALAELEGRGSAALATVVSTRGSTPRKTGAKMLVSPDDELVGTVGGGCGEAEVVRAAHEVGRTGRARTIAVDLTEDLLSWSPAVCGGVLEVFVEPVDRVAPDGGAPDGEAPDGEASGVELLDGGTPSDTAGSGNG